ncbi:MAG: rod shape-determining protein [Campylobacterales bacterium]|jgi:rod shape-determining protein MreB
MFARKRLYAIDLGTDNTIVYEPGRGIIFNEPTCIAMHLQSRQVLCVGHAAKAMTGKTPPHISVIRPLAQGAVANLNATALLIRHLIDMLMKQWRFFGPTIAVSVPFDLNTFERDAVREAGRQAGAHDVLLIEDPYSAAIGAGMDLFTPDGSLLLDVGSGVTEISLLSLGEIVASHSVRSTAWDFEQGIIDHVNTRYNGVISRCEAERLKLQYANGGPDEKRSVAVHLKNRVNALPEAMQFPLSEVNEALKPGLRKLSRFVKEFLRTLPPEFAPYIKENGLYITGGGALLKGLKERIEQEFSLKTVSGRAPLHEIAVGAGRIIEDRALCRHFTAGA